MSAPQVFSPSVCLLVTIFPFAPPRFFFGQTAFCPTTIFGEFVKLRLLHHHSSPASCCGSRCAAFLSPKSAAVPFATLRPLLANDCVTGYRFAATISPLWPGCHWVFWFFCLPWSQRFTKGIKGTVVPRPQRCSPEVFFQECSPFSPPCSCGPAGRDPTRQPTCSFYLFGADKIAGR